MTRSIALRLAVAGGLFLVAIVASAMLHADKASDGSWLSLGEMLSDPRGVVAWIAGIASVVIGALAISSFARRRFGD